ncbi:hypothetical protein BYT27DRAFT_6873298 [Phlegmacium glaucopus]|nr:hypothetical protein BYT27DRAFT_6873298 [Phlegmacium glaucopus]
MGWWPRLWSEGWTRGCVNHVFIGHLSMLKCCSAVDALLLSFFASCFSTSFSCTLLLNLSCASMICGLVSKSR